MTVASYPLGNIKRKIEIQKPPIQNQAEEYLWQDIRKFSRLIPTEPEPNMGRVDEIKEEIKKGAYLTPEVIEETVARLAIRFMRRE